MDGEWLETGAEHVIQPWALTSNTPSLPYYIYVRFIYNSADTCKPIRNAGKCVSPLKRYTALIVFQTLPPLLIFVHLFFYHLLFCISLSISSFVPLLSKPLISLSWPSTFTESQFSLRLFQFNLMVTLPPNPPPLFLSVSLSNREWMSEAV